MEFVSHDPAKRFFFRFKQWNKGGQSLWNFKSLKPHQQDPSPELSLEFSNILYMLYALSHPFLFSFLLFWYWGNMDYKVTEACVADAYIKLCPRPLVSTSLEGSQNQHISSSSTFASYSGKNHFHGHQIGGLCKSAVVQQVLSLFRVWLWFMNRGK